MNTQLKNAITQRDHIQGIRAAPLELVEYGDYQCSSCSESYVVVKEVLRELGKDIVFIFRNFPLIEIHPFAYGAALAAEAAALQNKFWEMYNLLYQNQAHLSGPYLFAYAETIGLDMDQFRRDIQSKSLVSKIEADVEGGLKSGVSGTPSFYINGEKYDGDWDSDGLIQYLKKLVRSAVK